MEGSSGGSERGSSGEIVYMMEGLITLGADVVAMALAEARASDLISGVRRYWEFREEN